MTEGVTFCDRGSQGGSHFMTAGIISSKFFLRQGEGWKVTPSRESRES